MEQEKVYEPKLNENQFNVLMTFLNRVELKGHEVPAYMEVMNALNQAHIESGKTKK